MLEPNIEKLITAARAVQGKFTLASSEFSAASVGATLRTVTGAIHTGVCADLACGIGFCAEHAAISEMLKHREVEIAAIVAVNDLGILLPCGRCRELMEQLSPATATRKWCSPTSGWSSFENCCPSTGYSCSGSSGARCPTSCRLAAIREKALKPN